MFVFDIEAVSINTTSVTTTWENTDSTVSEYARTERSKVESRWTTTDENPGKNGTTGFSPTTSYTSFVTSEIVTRTLRDPTAGNDTTGKMSPQE